MYAVIMAGGGGTRLWPLSRDRKPKPFLPLLEDGRCLLAATAARLSPLVESSDVFVITDVRYADLVGETIPGIPAGNVVGEPVGRNTAAAVALAAEAIDRPDDEVMIVLPADQAVRDGSGYLAALQPAAERAAGGDMVTLGIEPTEPSTGYGYVVAEGPARAHAGRPTYRVVRFEEKPTPQRAAELIAEGGAYWNAGIFVWRRDVVRSGLARHAADIVEPLRARLATIEGRPSSAPGAGAPATPGWPGAALTDAYATLRATSIDYALLEPASREGQVAVVPAAIGWSDLGSWSALRDYRGSQGDTVVSVEEPARVIDVGGRDVLVHAAGGRLVAIVGLEGVIVVDTPDALLVAAADAAQDVKAVVDRLRAEGRTDLL
jgi:mannose-1-phosphate guanylyltransferase